MVRESERVIERERETVRGEATYWDRLLEIVRG
jgi:hypothetical protein